MRFRLMPRDEGFYPLFKEAADNAVGCATVLRELAARPEDAGPLVEKLVESEHRGDELVRAVHDRLDKSIVTPFDREDILALIEEIDRAVDDMRAAGEFMHLHHITEPLVEVIEIAGVVHDTAEAASRLMVKLPKMRDLRPELDEIDQLETRGDDLYRRIMAHLFSGEFKAFTVLRWKDVVESFEKALNSFEKMSDIVASIAVKHS
jgi:predicted phosphate transport protein (TIGR00153 family)